MPTIGGITPGGLVMTCRKHGTGTQTPAAYTGVPVSLSTTTFNRGSTTLDTSTADAITVPTGWAGPYLFVATINFVGGDDDIRNGYITVNGTTTRAFGGSGSEFRASLSDILILAAGDVVKLNAFVGYASTATVITNDDPKDTSLSLTRLGN